MAAGPDRKIPPKPAPKDINKPDAEGYTYLHRLCMANAPVDELREAVQVLGADINKPDSKGFPPLAAMIEHGGPSGVRAMLDLGAEMFLNLPGNKTFNAVAFATWSVRPDALDVLLEKGGAAFVNAPPGLLPDKNVPDYPPLHLAVYKSVTDTAYAHTWSTVRMARSLVRAGAFVELEAGPESLAPLMLAATGRSPYLIDVLHQGGASLEQAHSKTGMKPLHFSIKENKRALSDHLLDIGADAGSVTADGTSALMMAADNGDTDLEGKLIAKKAPVNYQQPGGKRETALMRAGRRGNMKGIGILLDADADPLLTDAFNFRASHHARQNYNRMAAEALEEAETKALARHMDKALDQETKPPRP